MAELTVVQGMNLEGFIPWAHQGGPGDGIPGNSMAAFKRAWDMGYRHLETDVRLTRGGLLVLAHDPTLELDNEERFVANLHNVDARRARRNGHSLITLDDLLEEFPDAIISIDSKWDEREGAGPIRDGGARRCIETIDRHNAFGRVCISSFNGDRIRYMRKLSPQGTVSTLGEDELTGLAIDLIDPSSPHGNYDGQIVSISTHVNLPDGVHEVINPETIAGAHDRGLKVHVWGDTNVEGAMDVNDPKAMKKLILMGVDGLYVDNIAGLKQVLIDLGKWQDYSSN